MDQTKKTDILKSSARPSEAAVIISGPPLNDRDEKIVKLWNQGKSAGEIATELHVTRNTVMGKIWRLRQKGAGLEKHERPNTRGANAKPRRPRRSAPLLDLIFKRAKADKIRAVAERKISTDAKPLNITFWQLKSSSCRYVVNEGRPENFIFCGAPKERGQYCEAHALICYIPPRLRSPQQQHPTSHRQSYR